jgi:hypothetical protein
VRFTRFNFGAAEEENGSGDGNGADGSGSEGKKVFVKAEVLSPSLSEVFERLRFYGFT